MTNNQRRPIEEWLSQIRYIRAEIEELTAAKMEAWDSATRVVTQLSGMPGSQSKNPHKFERYAELDGNLSALLEAKTEAIAERMAAIEQVQESKLRVVLIARYINCKRWDDISVALGYLPVTESDMVFRLHRQALDEIAKIIEAS